MRSRREKTGVRAVTIIIWCAVVHGLSENAAETTGPYLRLKVSMTS